MGLYRGNGKANGTYREYEDYVGFYWGYTGIMENKMETTILHSADGAIASSGILRKSIGNFLAQLQTCGTLTGLRCLLGFRV